MYYNFHYIILFSYLCFFNDRWYTKKIDLLIEVMNREFQKTADGKFWAAVGSYHDILTAKDLIGRCHTVRRHMKDQYAKQNDGIKIIIYFFI